MSLGIDPVSGREGVLCNGLESPELENDVTAAPGGEDETGRNIAGTEWARSVPHISAAYLLFYAAIGSLMPFIALYYRELGFSGLQIGVLTSLSSLGMAIFGPLWGLVSDSLAIHRHVLRVALALGGVVAVATTQVTSFAPLFVLMGLLAFVSVPVAPLLDSYGMAISERIGKSYGGLRVWGSIGYSFSVLAVGWIMGDDVSVVLLGAHGAFLALALLAVIRLPALGERRAMPLFAGISEIRRNWSFLLLMLVAYLISSGAAVMNIYLGIRLEDIGGSATEIGLAFAVSSVSELPVIAFGAWFLHRVGAVRLAALAICVYGVRFVGFSLITVPAWLLPVQALHGLSYGAFLMASVTLAHRLAGRQHAATAQGLLTAMSFGFGSITGSIVGGAFLDRVGTGGLFQGAAVLMVVTLMVLLAGNRLVGLDDARPVSQA